jgi:predicted O-methyltransferase YrrM
VIAQAMKSDGKLYAIDPFFKGRIGISYPKIVAKINFRRNKVEDKIRLIEKYSYDAVNDVSEEIDFIFIDGDHSYKGLKLDWEMWLPKVKSGGIIALHDTNERGNSNYKNELGSIKFYDEVISKSEEVVRIDYVHSLNIYRRYNLFA